MKKSLPILLIASGIISVAFAFRIAQRIELKTYANRSIVSYNCENLFDTINDESIDDEEFLPTSKLKWNTERYNKKLDHLVEALTLNLTENPMMMGLMEIENYQVLRDLAYRGKLKESKYAIAHKNSPDKRGIDVALIYDQELFQPTQIQYLEVSIDTAKNFFTRDVLYVHGKVFGEKEMHVFVNHWPSRRGGDKTSEYKRERAAAVVREKVDQILAEDPKANIIIMGDLNDHPGDKSIYETLKAKERKDKKADLVDLMFEAENAGKGTHYYDGWGCLDHFIVSKSLLKGKGKIKLKTKKVVIIEDDRLFYTPKEGPKKPATTYSGLNYYGGYSDHLPIQLQLK